MVMYMHELLALPTKQAQFVYYYDSEHEQSALRGPP